MNVLRGVNKGLPVVVLKRVQIPQTYNAKRSHPLSPDEKEPEVKVEEEEEVPKEVKVFESVLGVKAEASAASRRGGRPDQIWQGLADNTLIFYNPEMAHKTFWRCKICNFVVKYEEGNELLYHYFMDKEHQKDPNFKAADRQNKAKEQPRAYTSRGRTTYLQTEEGRIVENKKKGAKAKPVDGWKLIGGVWQKVQ